MRPYIEGLIFIPQARVASRQALIERVLAFIGGPQQIVDQNIDILGTNTRTLAPLEVLEQLSHSDNPGWFLIDLGGFRTEVWFEPPQQGYYIPRLKVDKYAFLEIEGDPGRVEVFSAAWVRFCEALQASAAVFSRELGYFDGWQVVERRLAALLKRDMAAFQLNVDWRTYLEAELAGLWREQKRRDPLLVEDLPSGALVIHDEPGYNPELGDFDTVLQMDFFINYLKMHQDLPGSDRLLARLQEQRAGPLQRYLELREATIPKPREEYSHMLQEKLTLFDALSDLLADMRATLVCAHKMPDVVDLCHPVMLHEETGEEWEIEVPIVRAAGHVWMIATLLYPFKLNSSAWEDEQEGLRARVQRLLVAARQHPVGGEPPRVVVFFWRGVSPEVRAALVALGVGVEVADHLPVLVEGYDDRKPSGSR
ncbi:MAG TPA: hypothetical protein VKV40_00350 [Ktedonobacteraceae bacterium]|jgi:hypothetical protein|nr:hypothetical protein [Ktedonobacteraceae bacterium]